jgi:hypothetical protein
VEVYYDGRGEMFFRGGWPHLQRIMTCIKAFSCSSITIVVRRSLT